MLAFCVKAVPNKLWCAFGTVYSSLFRGKNHLSLFTTEVININRKTCDSFYSVPPVSVRSLFVGATTECVLIRLC